MFSFGALIAILHWDRGRTEGYVRNRETWNTEGLDVHGFFFSRFIASAVSIPSISSISVSDPSMKASPCVFS